MFIDLYPIKGGVGTSVIAATLAGSLPSGGESLLMFTRNRNEINDQVAIFGVPTLDHIKHGEICRLSSFPRDGFISDQFTTWITLSSHGHFAPEMYTDLDHVIAIHTPYEDKTKSAFDDAGYMSLRIAIVENSYMALSRFAKDNVEYDYAIVSTSDGPLTMQDCRNVMMMNNNTAFEWPHDAAIQRAVDAGIYVGRLDRLKNQSIKPIIKAITRKENHASNK